MFKLAFKQYKAKSSSPDLTEVINVDDIEARQNDPQQKDNVSTRPVAHAIEYRSYLLIYYLRMFNV